MISFHQTGVPSAATTATSVSATSQFQRHRPNTTTSLRIGTTHAHPLSPQSFHTVLATPTYPLVGETLETAELRLALT